MSIMRRGTLVRVKQNSSFRFDAFNHRGSTGRLVSAPERCAIDWHRNDTAVICRVRFGPGRIAEIEIGDLEPIDDAITRLAELGQFLPTEKDIGRGVVYTPPHGGPSEDGVITGMNDEYVFVRYAGQHPGASGKATRHEDLRWLSER